MKPAPIDCAATLEWLLEREDGSPAEPERSAACMAHLEACAACRAQSARLGAALGALRQRALDPLPAIDVWSGVRKSLAAEGRLASASPVAAAAPLPVRRPGALRRVGTFAALAAALACAWFVWPSGSQQPSSTSPAPSPIAARATGSPAAPQPTLVAATAEGASATSAAALPLSVDPALAPATPARGLRRAPGEERRRDLSVPFEAAAEPGAWSLVSDRDLR